nr:hypothetical protein [Tanacetum cinerariifolium]
MLGNGVGEVLVQEGVRLLPWDERRSFGAGGCTVITLGRKVNSVGFGRKNGLKSVRPGSLEVGSIRRIQEIGYGVLEFLGVGTTFNRLKWMIPTLLSRSISGLRKKKLIGVVRCITRKLLHMVRSWINDDVHDLESVEIEFPDIVFNDTLTSEAALSCEPTVISLNDEIDFKISFDESDDEDYTIAFDKNSFSYKIISANDLKTNSENDNDKVDMPSFLLPEPTVSYFDDFEYFKDFENEFPAIVYNDSPTSKSDLLTELILSPQHIDKFNLKEETSFSECDEEEQNVLNFNDLFSFNEDTAPELHKKPRRLKDLYTVSRSSHTPYSRINSRNILEYYNRGPHSKEL